LYGRNFLQVYYAKFLKLRIIFKENSLKYFPIIVPTNNEHNF
jgi:hypothetical protein